MNKTAFVTLEERLCLQPILPTKRMGEDRNQLADSVSVGTLYYPDQPFLAREAVSRLKFRHSCEAHGVNK